MSSYDTNKVAAIHRELHSHLPSEPALRVKALESLLVEKGLVDSAAIDGLIDVYSDEIGPKRGAQVVARAWTDAAFKDRLLADAAQAIGEFGFSGRGAGHLQVVENTTDTHNVVVCTLCSCYPFGILGMSPAWYKSNEYRSRVVRDPRGVLAEFGVDVPDDVRVRVWDSTSEQRYMVLPRRPEGTEELDEAALAAIVTRNALIGTDVVRAPGADAAATAGEAA